MRDERLPRSSVEELRRLLKEGRYRSRLATDYQLALQLAQDGETAQADQLLRKLLEERPDLPEFIVAEAKLENQLGRGRAALQRLHRALATQPASHALNLAYADQAIGLGEYPLAVNQLTRYLDYSHDDPSVYALLARAVGETGDSLSAHKFQAEYHYLNGNLEEAILQLEIALKTPGISFFDSASIESRLDQLRAEEKTRKSRE